MKKIVGVIVTLLFLQQAFAQQFTLNGKLSGVHMDSVMVSYTSAAAKYVHETYPISLSGEFTVTGNISRPTSSTILFKNKGEVISSSEREARTKNFYLEPGTIALTGNPAMLAGLKITGSKTQIDKDELDKLTASIHAEEQPIIDALYKEKDHDKASAIRDKLDPFRARIKKVKYAFFLTHPSSYVTADEMRVLVSDMRLDSIKRIYNGYNAELKESTQGKNLEIEIKKIEAGSPGNIAAEFSRTDINGKPLSLADFKGKYVMLDFWASWCVPCREGSPHMLALYNKYKDKGYEVIGIADDDTKPELWKGAIAKDKVGVWHHVLRGLDMDMARKGITNPNDINGKYGIHTIPTKILIDPTGKIIGRFGDSYGGSDEDMDKMLASIFGK